jgi:hypothetical protein
MRRDVFRLGLALLTLLGAASAAAQEGRGRGGGGSAAASEVSVWVIRATKDNNEVSKELEPIAAQLRGQFKLTGYKLVKREAGAGGPGKPFSAALPNGYRVRVAPQKREGARVTLKVEVTRKRGDKEERKLDTTFTLDAGKFQLVGGWPFAEQGEDVLILAISGR